MPRPYTGIQGAASAERCSRPTAWPGSFSILLVDENVIDGPDMEMLAPLQLAAIVPFVLSACQTGFIPQVNEGIGILLRDSCPLIPLSPVDDDALCGREGGPGSARAAIIPEVLPKPGLNVWLCEVVEGISDQNSSCSCKRDASGWHYPRTCWGDHRR